jgi:hypothetical protein
MRFMLLLKSDAHTEAGHMPSPELLAAMGKYNDELTRAGVLLTGDGLQASMKGFRLRPDGANARVVDGPFPEPAELIAGFWILQVKSKAEAIEWAKRCPLEAGAEGAGQIEVRQVMDHGPQREQVPAEEARKPARPAADGGGRKRRYLMMVKTDGQHEEGPPPDPATLQRMRQAMAELTRAGVMEAAEGLHPTSRGARVYIGKGKRKGKRTVVDGPFAEAKELVCGFAIMRAADKREAIELAKAGLALRNGYGETEARLLFEAEDFADAPR